MPDVIPQPDPPPPPNPPPKSAFEWSLSALRPADADVARPSFMYKAGQASRDKAVRFWRVVAVFASLVTVGVVGVAVLLLMLTMSALVRERAPQGEAFVVETPPPAVREVDRTPELPPRPFTPDHTPSTAPSAGDIAAALAKRREVLIGGLGLIPPTPPPAPVLAGPLTPNTGVFAAPR